jgi:O-antigen ligase
MTVAGIAGAAYLFLQRLGLDPWAWTGNVDTWSGRQMGFAGQPVFSGALLALALPWVASWWAVAGIASAAYLTGSRAALLAAGVVVGWRLWDKPARRPFLVALAALGVFMVCHIHRAASDGQRVEFNRVAIKAWSQRPVLGWGPATGSVWFIRCRSTAGAICKHSHNLVTNVLATQGLLGLAAWALLLVTAWRVATYKTREALLSMAVFGMFEPVPAVAYVVIALAVGMDASPPVCATRRRRGLTALAALLFAFLSWELVADRYAHSGDWGRAADMCPWEYAYCERVSDKAVASAWRHQDNPMVYTGAIEALRVQGKPRSAEVLVRIANRMDPLRLSK